MCLQQLRKDSLYTGHNNIIRVKQDTYQIPKQREERIKMQLYQPPSQYHHQLATVVKTLLINIFMFPSI